MSLGLVIYTKNNILVATDNRVTKSEDWKSFEFVNDDAVKISLVRDGLCFHGSTSVLLSRRFNEIVQENNHLPTKELIKLVQTFPREYCINGKEEKVIDTGTFLCGEDEGQIFYLGSENTEPIYVNGDNEVKYNIHCVDKVMSTQLVSYLSFLFNNGIPMADLINNFMVYGAFLSPQTVSPTFNIWSHKIKN